MDVVNICGMVGNQFVLVELINCGVKIVVWVIQMNCFMNLCGMLYYFFWYVVYVNIGVVQFFGFDECVFLVVYSGVVN